MAGVRWYLNNTTLNGWQLVDQTAATAATMAAGWVVGTGLTNSSELQSGTERASSTFVGNTVPDGTLDTTLKDAFRSQFAQNGDFAAGNWTFQFAVVSTVQSGAADGQIVFRVLKANADGSSATEITTAQQSTTVATNVAGTDVNITATWAAPAWTISNQYIFVQVAWKRTGAGGMTTTNIRLRTGSSATVGTTGLTADFTPRVLAAHIPPSSRTLYNETLLLEQAATGTNLILDSPVNYGQSISGHTGLLTSVSLSLELRAGSAPTDSIYVEVRLSTITGTLLATSTQVVCATLPVLGSAAFIQFWFLEPILMASGTTYVLTPKLTRSETPVGNHGLNLGSTSTNPYGGGQVYLSTGSAFGGDATFRLYTGTSLTVTQPGADQAVTGVHCASTAVVNVHTVALPLDVTIDGAVSTASARGARTMVFPTPMVGYVFFVDASGQFGYSKTTDGGSSWGGHTLIDATTPVLAFDIWFDQWTPGISGTLIHCWWIDGPGHDAVYRTLDTATDTLGTTEIIFHGSSAVAGRGVFVSGTKARNGYLYCAFDIDAGAEKALYVRNVSNWSLVNFTFVEATLDTCKLFPASNTGDDRDLFAVYYDASATALTVKLYDYSADTTAESSQLGSAHTDGPTDLTGQFGYDAAVRHSNGHLIIAKVTERDAAGASDHQIVDFTGTGDWQLRNSIAASTDDHYFPQVFINQTTGTVFVAYNGKRDGSETLDTASKVYYTYSTDNGTTWDTGDNVYMQDPAGPVQQVWTPMSGQRFYIIWRTGTTLWGNATNSLVQLAAGLPTIAATSVVNVPTVEAEAGVLSITGAFIGGGAAWTLIDSAKSNTYAATINATNATVLVAHAAHYNGGGSITDSSGNTWSALPIRGAEGARSQLFICYTPASNAALTITLGGAAGYASMQVASFLGAVGTAGLNNGSGLVNAATVSTGSISPTAGDLVVTGEMTENGGHTPTVAGFTVLQASPYVGGVSEGGALAWCIAAGGSIDATWNHNVSTYTAASIGSVVASVVYDDFQRADNTSSLGTTYSGHVWNPRVGTWGIEIGAAKCFTPTAQNIATIDAGVSDGTVTCRFQQQSNDAGLVGRCIDANNYWVWVTRTTESELYVNVGGTFTSMGTAVGAYIAGVTVQIEFAGTSIICRRNGSVVFSITDATHLTGTEFGIRDYAAPYRLFEDFAFVSAGVSGGGGGALYAPTVTFPAGADQGITTLNIASTLTLTLPTVAHAGTELTKVQSTPKINVTTALSFTIPFTTPPTVGNGIVIPFAARIIGSTASEVGVATDSEGNTFAVAVHRTGYFGYVKALIYYLPVLSAVTAPYSVTVTFPPPYPGNATALGIEVTNVDQGLIVDISASEENYGVQPTTGTTGAATVDTLFSVAMYSISGSNASRGFSTVDVATPVWAEEYEELLRLSPSCEANSRVVTGQTGLTQSVGWTTFYVDPGAAVLAGFRASPDLVVVGATIARTSQAFALTVAEALPDTITTTNIASTALVRVPTIQPGAVGVTPPARATTIQVFVPTLAPGAVGITLPTRGTTLQVFAPSVAPGAVTIVGATRPTTIQVFTPSVTVGPTSVTTAHRLTTLQMFLPIVALAGITNVGAATVGSTAQVFAPTLSVGVASVTLPQRATTIQVFAPMLSAMTLGATIPSGSGLFVPSLALTVSTAHRASTEQVFLPTVVRPAVQAITAQTVASTVVVQVPSVSPGAVFITLPHRVTSIAINAPSIAVGAVTVTTPGRVTTVQMFAPFLTVGATSITTATVATTGQVFLPIVGLAGVINVGVGTVFSAAQVYALTVTTGAVTVTLPRIVSVQSIATPSLAAVVALAHRSTTGLVRVPSVTTGAVTIVAGTRPATSQAFAPIISVGGTILGGAHIPSSAQLYPVLLIARLDGTFITSTALLFPPVVLAHQTATGATIPSTLVLRAPSVTTVTLVGGATITTTAQMYALLVDRGLTVGFIDTTAQLYGPEIEPEVGDIYVGGIAPQSRLFPPSLGKKFPAGTCLTSGLTTRCHVTSATLTSVLAVQASVTVHSLPAWVVQTTSVVSGGVQVRSRVVSQGVRSCCKEALTP